MNLSLQDPVVAGNLGHTVSRYTKLQLPLQCLRTERRQTAQTPACQEQPVQQAPALAQAHFQAKYQVQLKSARCKYAIFNICAISDHTARWQQQDQDTHTLPDIMLMTDNENNVTQMLTTQLSATIGSGSLQ